MSDLLNQFLTKGKIERSTTQTAKDRLGHLARMKPSDYRRLVRDVKKDSSEPENSP